MISPSYVDLERPDNVVQARWELDRCSTGEHLAAWAEKWGRSALELLDTTDLRAEVEAAQTEATEFEDEVDRLRLTVQEAVDRLDRLQEHDSVSPAAAALVANIIGDLDQALTK